MCPWWQPTLSTDALEDHCPIPFSTLFHSSCVLVMEFIPAVSIATACETGFLGPKTLARVSHDLGRSVSRSECVGALAGRVGGRSVSGLRTEVQ